MADLTGLVIGFALGGAALVHFLPQIEHVWRPEMLGQAPARQVRVPSVAPRPAVLGPPRLAPVPDSPALMPAPAPLPRINEPDESDPAEPPPVRGTGVAGTGFFVADGLVMTAAHVVTACRRVEIVSPFVRRSLAHVAARDTRHDIALLDAAGVQAPATLAIGRPTASGARVFVLGYPATAGLLIPEATWGTLENDKLPRQPASLTDPREQVWMEASQVTHGYSGGPIFDPRSGKVVGIVRAMLDGGWLRAIRGMPESGMTIGPGSALLNAFLENAAPGTDAFPADQWGDDPLTVVRHATVHVFCWH
ncbi:MAG TPA: serine protease [Acetobacteraceae bacterium]|nr:serine protease [Acetobacteraceae bacterium]